MTLKDFFERNIAIKTNYLLQTNEGNYERMTVDYLEHDREKLRIQFEWIYKQIEKNVKVKYIDVLNNTLDVTLLEPKQRKKRS